MPGFIQSIKSHLPPSPFSPTKKNVPALVVPEVVAPAADNAVVEEQPSSEVLPGEALVQHNTSTVALTLTPANGESSQQLISNDETVINSEEPIPQSDSPAEVVTPTPETCVIAEPTEASTESSVPEAAPSTSEEVPLEAATEAPEASAPETVAVESTLAPEVDASTTPETIAVEAVQPQEETVEASSADQVVEEAAEPCAEPAVATETSNDAPAASTEVDAAKPAVKPGKETFSTHIKRSKSKKSKSDSPETSDAAESGASKPRKSNPLAGKFRSVIDQVRFKVKKDKDALITKGEPTTPPALVVSEPTPVLEETPVAA